MQQCHHQRPGADRRQCLQFSPTKFPHLWQRQTPSRNRLAQRYPDPQKLPVAPVRQFHCPDHQSLPTRRVSTHLQITNARQHDLRLSPTDDAFIMFSQWQSAPSANASGSLVTSERSGKTEIRSPFRINSSSAQPANSIIAHPITAANRADQPCCPTPRCDGSVLVNVNVIPV